MVVPMDYSNGYGTHGCISMSHGMYGYDGYASRWRHIAEQLELHHLWRHLEMTDDIRRWMTPDGIEYGNARAEMRRWFNALGLRLHQKAEESTKLAEKRPCKRLSTNQHSLVA